MNVVLRSGLVIFATLFALFFGAGTVNSQTPIGGVVNRYVSVTNVIPCDSLVAVGNPSAIKPGDRVLLIQMKGAVISDKNDANFGTIVDIAGAGAAEFLTIKSVNTDKVTFTTRMVHNYDVTGAIQLVSVPVYANARVTSAITAPPWNGTIGGVVALEVTGDLYLSDDIKVDGLGFVGGRLSVPRSRCDVTDYLLNWDFGLAGEKGEGIASLRVNYTLAGRGPLANGGGGGNGNNAGGGGGSNGGSGGNGGDANLYCTDSSRVGGLPGNVVSSYITEQHFFFGGGGGGSHQNDLQGTNGSNGGGIVIIKAGVLYGNGRQISANAVDVTDLADMDAAGGGGAGGTIVLDVGMVSNTLYINALGGNGGSVKHMYNAHGPGGGGGGGVVVTTQVLSNIVTNLRGGTAGTHTTASNEAYGQSRNAINGEPGMVIPGFRWKTPRTTTLGAWGGGAVCENYSSARLEATPGFATYTWSDGQTGRVVYIDTPGTYSVIAVDSSGCARSAGAVSVWRNPTQFSLPKNLDFAAVAFQATKWMALTFLNTDDEDITIDRFVDSQNFRVVSPNILPVVVPAGGSIPIIVEFYAIEDRTYNEVIRVFITAPCPDSQDVAIHAVVSPIWATFSTPDTTASVGDTSFAMPLYVYITPDTTSLKATHLVIDVSMDSRIFAPLGVTNGTIIGNVIDVLTNTRTLTIEIDSIDLHGKENVVTRIRGAVLMSTISESPVYSSDVQWTQVWQQPITDHDGGSIAVDPVCFQNGRAIKLFEMPTIAISPNPASEVLQVATRLSAPGEYSVQIVDILGNEVLEESISYIGTTAEDRVFTFDATTWPSGTYAVVYSTPLVAFTKRFVISH